MLMGGATVPWASWIVPLAFWLIYSLCCIFFNLFFSLICSHRIINIERLPFPLASAYIHVIDEPKKPFMERTGIKLMLAGIIIGFIFQSTYDLLPAVIPGFPDIWPRDYIGTRAIDLGPILGPDITGNQLVWFPLMDALSLVALFFLIPSSVTGTAILVNFIVANIIPIIEVKMGMVTPLTQFGLYSLIPYLLSHVGTIVEPTGIQLWILCDYGFTIGAGLTYIAMSGRSLSDSFMSAVKGGKTGPFSSRLIWLGFIGSLVVYLALNLVSTVPIHVALLYAVLSLLTMHIMVREAGEGFPAGAGPGKFEYQCSGYLAIGGEAVRNTPVGYSTIVLGFASGQIQSSVPYNTLLSIRLCEMTKRKTKWSSVVIAAIAGFIVSNIVAFIIYIWGAYTWGFQAKWTGMMYGTTDADDYISRFSTPGASLYQGSAEMRVWPELIVGIIISAVVTILRFQFVWFPIHPIGLILGSCLIWGVLYWFVAIIGFIARVLVLRIGGSELYEKKGVPLAIGIMVGTGICSFIWALVLLAQTIG